MISSFASYSKAERTPSGKTHFGVVNPNLALGITKRPRQTFCGRSKHAMCGPKLLISPFQPEQFEHIMAWDILSIKPIKKLLSAPAHPDYISKEKNMTIRGSWGWTSKVDNHVYTMETLTKQVTNSFDPTDDWDCLLNFHLSSILSQSWIYL